MQVYLQSNQCEFFLGKLPLNIRFLQTWNDQVKQKVSKTWRENMRHQTGNDQVKQKVSKTWRENLRHQTGNDQIKKMSMTYREK